MSTHIRSAAGARFSDGYISISRPNDLTAFPSMYPISDIDEGANRNDAPVIKASVPLLSDDVKIKHLNTRLTAGIFSLRLSGSNSTM